MVIMWKRMILDFFFEVQSKTCQNGHGKVENVEVLKRSLIFADRIIMGNNAVMRDCTSACLRGRKGLLLDILQPCYSSFAFCLNVCFIHHA